MKIKPDRLTFFLASFFLTVAATVFWLSGCSGSLETGIEPATGIPFVRLYWSPTSGECSTSPTGDAVPIKLALPAVAPQTP